MHCRQALLHTAPSRQCTVHTHVHVILYTARNGDADKAIPLHDKCTHAPRMRKHMHRACRRTAQPPRPTVPMRSGLTTCIALQSDFTHGLQLLIHTVVKVVHPLRHINCSIQSNPTQLMHAMPRQIDAAAARAPQPTHAMITDGPDSDISVSAAAEVSGAGGGVGFFGQLGRVAAHAPSDCGARASA